MGEWKQIDSAPKDGTWIMLWRGESRLGIWEPLIIARWEIFDDGPSWAWPDDAFFDPFTAKGRRRADKQIAHGYCYNDDESFTHWMPLPSPPTL